MPRNSVLLWLFACLLIACSAKPLPPKQYIHWMAANKHLLTAQAPQKDFSVSLLYLPANWLALQEVGPNDIKRLSTASHEYAGMEYYRLRIALQNSNGDILQFKASSTDEYYQRVEYFSFGVQQDIKLLNKQDTLPCRLFHFERNYGAAPYVDFMLGFEEQKDNRSDRTLLYQDRVYSKHLIQLTIPYTSIQRVPQLNLPL